MLAMMISRLVILLLLNATAWCADYQIVLKSSGRVLHGEYVSEDATSITVNINHAEATFKKEKLDLDRMHDLNKAGMIGVAPPAGTPGNNDKYQAIVADEIKHRENSLGTAKKFLADCQTGRIKCTDGDYKLANAQIEDSQRTLRELKLEHGTYEDNEEQELVNRHKQLIDKMNAARKAFVDAENDKAATEVIAARRRELNRLQDEFDQVEKAMMKRKQ